MKVDFKRDRAQLGRDEDLLGIDDGCFFFPKFMMVLFFFLLSFRDRGFVGHSGGFVK